MNRTPWLPNWVFMQATEAWLAGNSEETIEAVYWRTWARAFPTDLDDPWLDLGGEG